MTTFEKELDVQELELHRKLCWMDEIVYVLVEIEYDISQYHPATWWSPSEGGEIEDWNVKVIDKMFNEKQSKIIKDSLNEDWIIEAIWDHYEANKNKIDDWY